MTKAELIEKVYDRVFDRNPRAPGLTKKLVGDIVDTCFSEIGIYFIKSKVTRSQRPRLTYPAFGTFAKRRRAPKRVWNPHTREMFEIPPTTTVTFTPGRDLKRQLNGLREAG